MVGRMKVERSRDNRSSRGQSLVETAIMLPLLLMLMFNAVNFGYFLLVAVNLTGSSRNSVEYAIMGASTPAHTQPPTAGPTTGGTGTLSVTYLAQQDLTGALVNPTGASVTVCTTSLGTTSGASNCCTYTGTGACANSGSDATTDPEATFILDEVDVAYTVNTLIPGRIFNIPLQATGMCRGGTCTFTRRVRMRAMN